MHDLVIRDGWVVDGAGTPRFRGDVAVKEGRIVRIGRIAERARRTIDAEGHVVAPGFVDGHTHMDAQIFWDPLGSCSSYHGVTSVVMGNCGFTLAPCAERDAGFVFRNLERAEDISPEAMQAGIEWSWETFPEFLDNDRRAAERHPLRGLHWALRAADVRHGRTRLHGTGDVR